MNRIEFASCMHVLTSAIMKPMPESTAEVYFDLLGDLPVDVLKLAVRRVLLEHRITTIPTIAELRQLATEIMNPETVMDSGEAFGLARAAIREFGWPSQSEGMASLPPLVAQVVRQIGWATMCESENPEAMRAHFLKMFDAARSSNSRVENQPIALRDETSRVQKIVGRTAAGMKGIE